jgi:hypothetical protein
MHTASLHSVPKTYACRIYVMETKYPYHRSGIISVLLTGSGGGCGGESG